MQKTVKKSKKIKIVSELTNLQEEHKTTIASNEIKRPELLDSQNLEKDKLENVKTTNLNQNPTEEEKDKSQHDKLNCLKSFSCQNLIKLDGKNENEEVLANSFDTNCSRKK